MGIIIDKETNIVVLGITGKEGSRATKEMIESGSKVSCGVTPGKSGLIIENKPVFDSLREAIHFDSKINTAVLYVPPLMVYDAAIEAIENKIKTIIIVTENTPIKDSAKIIELAKENNCRIIGPSSVGLISVGLGKIGSIGFDKRFSKGNIGIISKSGGLCAETASLLTKNNLGQSTVIGIGGDILIGSTFSDLLSLFEKDPDTKAVVIIGEIGGTYEEQVAEMLIKKEFTKPLIAFIAGKFVQSIKRELSFGHSGAIIEFGSGNVETKKEILKKSGALIANYHDEIPDLVKKALKL